MVRSIRYTLERGQEQEALRKAHVELENRVRERTADPSDAKIAAPIPLPRDKDTSTR